MRRQSGERYLRRLLLGLPVTHGKASKGLQIRCRKQRHVRRRSCLSPLGGGCACADGVSLAWVLISEFRDPPPSPANDKDTPVTMMDDDDWPAPEAAKPPRPISIAAFLLTKSMRSPLSPPASLFISSWRPCRHSRACMCIWVQVSEKEGGRSG